MPRNALVAEIGVNKGKFSQIILESSKPKKIHLIDSWGSQRYNTSIKKIVENKFESYIDQGIIEINQGLSTEVLVIF